MLRVYFVIIGNVVKSLVALITSATTFVKYYLFLIFNYQLTRSL
jgi:hypothetical protein